MVVKARAVLGQSRVRKFIWCPQVWQRFKFLEHLLFQEHYRQLDLEWSTGDASVAGENLSNAVPIHP